MESDRHWGCCRYASYNLSSLKSDEAMDLRRLFSEVPKMWSDQSKLRNAVLSKVSPPCIPFCEATVATRKTDSLSEVGEELSPSDEKAVKEFNVAEALRDRIVARREDY